MPLIVETGAVVANANSYASLDTVTAYHQARGNSDWLHSSEDAEPAILRAMDYLESLPWIGKEYDGPVGATGHQPLQWPRVRVVVNGYTWGCDEVPPQVVKALCEAALIELGNPGALAPELERGGMVLSESVDVISTTYASGAPAGTAYNKVKQHLRGLLCSSNVMRLERG